MPPPRSPRVRPLCLILALAAALGAQEARKQARVRAKIVNDRVVIRCQLTSHVATMPAYMFLAYDRLCGVELHNKVADALKIEENGNRRPFTVGFPGLDVEVEAREHGDEDLLNEFTKLYSPELEEIGVLGTIGANLLKEYHFTFDLARGFVEIADPKEVDPTPPSGGTARYIKADATTKLVWLPVELRGRHRRVIGIGGERYDSVVDELMCEEFEAPGGDIGSVEVGGFDLSKVVAWRPEELPYAHEDGALGVLGINFLKDFRVEIDRVNGWVGLTRTRESRFPEEERAFFRARATEDVGPVRAWLEVHAGTRLAGTAADLLLQLQIDRVATAEQLEKAVRWVDQTRHPALRATKAIDTMETLMRARLPAAAVVAGRLGVASGRLDRYPESVHRLHVRLGEVLLGEERDREAWEHLMSAAFGLNEAVGAADQAKVNLLLGEYYERKKRYKRAMSRYVQAVITPEAGEAAIAGLTRVQEKMGGETFSFELVDRLISGKVRGMTAPTEFVADAATATNRCVLIEHVTNPHLGRKQGEMWRAWTEGAAMVFEGLQTHFPRDRVVMLGYHMGNPRPVGITNAVAIQAAARTNDRPVFLLDGRQAIPGALEYHQADQGYSIMKGAVLKKLAVPSDYTVAVDARLEDGRVVGTATVKGPKQGGLRVEVILAERGVLYPGLGATVVHRMVARAALTEALEGVAYAPQRGAMQVRFDRALAVIEAANRKFLDKYEEEKKSIATRLSVGMAPDQLVVVVVVRGARGAVLQAGQTAVETKRD